MKRIAILQSAYIPWKGYFDIINMVDEFILYDDVQFKKSDWRSRNKIKTPQGTAWLTIPIQVKGNFGQFIKDCKVADHRWPEKHWRTLQHNYSRAPYYSLHARCIKDLYKKCLDYAKLSEINFLFINEICSMLDIKTPLKWSMDFDVSGSRSERLLSLCLQADADEYLTGEAARGYLDVELFQRKKVNVKWMDYNGYPQYSQLFSPPFTHHVSIIDLLFNEGSDGAKKFMLSF